MSLSIFYNKYKTLSWFNAIQKADEELGEACNRVNQESANYDTVEGLEGMTRDEAQRIVANFEERLEGSNVQEELKFTSELYDIAKTSLDAQIPESIKTELNW